MKIKPRPSPKNQTPNAQKNDRPSAESHGRAEQQSQTDSHLDERKEGVPNGDMGPDEIADIRDDPPDDVGLIVGVVQQIGRGEVTAEHEGLELQTRVEEPEQSQSDLEDPLCPHETEVPASAYDRRFDDVIHGSRSPFE